MIDEDVLNKTEFNNMEDYEIRESLGVSELKKRMEGKTRESDIKRNIINLGSINLYESKTKDTSIISSNSKRDRSFLQNSKLINKSMDFSN